MKKILAVALVTTAMIGTAAAQTTMERAPAATTATTTENTNPQGLWRSSKLVGVNVYNENNDKLGAINDIILDKEGRIENVVIGVGGFLGVGEHNIAVKFDQLRFVNEPVASAAATTTRPSSPATGTTTGSATNNTTTTTTTTTAPARNANAWYPDHAVLANATRDQLKAMPEFKY